jgi:MFS family permease
MSRLELEGPLLIFLVCAVMFHFANAAMLPLLGEMLAKGQGRSSMMFMSACVVTTQFVITLLASWTGRFNVTLGAISTAVGIGAALSQVIAGSIVHHFSANTDSLFLAAVALAAFTVLDFFMPETRNKQFLNPTQGAPTQ